MIAPDPIDPQLAQLPIIAPFDRSRKSASKGHWLSIILVSALVFIVLLLLLSALPN
ncbi:MAG TPA: hypothetical protein VGZ26_06380 [Pirellulales bacterium]|nr:hypothetical protein [Pirellulales bacterium]